MNKVIMKIVGYDEASYSLLVSFASDETKYSNPEAYPPLAFQPMTMWPDITDMNEIKKRIAVAGMQEVTIQAAKESFTADDSKVNALKGMVGQVSEFSAVELTAVNFVTPLATV